MKHILFIATILVALWACNEDETSFGIMMPGENLRFKALPGGSMMYYSLPKDANVYGMVVRYTNEKGKEVMKRASYVGDSLFLDGFDKEHKAVPAQVSLIDHDNKESETIDITFDTEESAPYAFFNDAQVLPSWDGFQLIYHAPDLVTGMAHVFYLGTDPKTGEPDSVLVKSFSIMAGGDTLVFPLKQLRDKNTVIVRTEGRNGYRVREKVWEEVEAYKKEKWTLKPENFNDFGLSVKSEEAATGVEYLFDGELKGMGKLQYGISDPYELVDKQFTYLAGPQAVGKPFVIDLGAKKIPAGMRIYAMQSIPVQFPYYKGQLFRHVWRYAYHDKLPCDITVYAGNDSDPNAGTWVEIGSYSQSPATISREKWCYPTEDQKKQVKSVREMQTADSIYVDVMFLASPNEYRYLKFIVNDTFDFMELDKVAPSRNLDQYITMHELEVYVKKD